MNTLNNLSLLACLLLSIVVLTTGCGNKSPSFSLLPDGDSFKQNKAIFNNQLDILWVVDNSGSMQPYQDNLTANFSSFITNFQTKGYDFKIAVTSTQAYLANAAHQNNPQLSRFSDGVSTHTGIFTILPTTPNINSVFLTNATLGASGSGDERAFSSFRESLNNTLPQNAGFLRQSSFLAVIILSDEDDFSGDGRCANCGTSHNYNAGTLDTVNSYVSYLDQKTATTGASRRYMVSNISVIDSACLAQHQASGSIMGTRYMQLTTATDGISASLCDSSYANALNAIQSKISELSSQFFLERIPQPETIVVKVNGAIIPQNATNGWTYNMTANSIVFHGNAIPPQGATIDIFYVPATIQN